MSEEKKTCSTCEVEKTIDSFYFIKNSNNYRNQCKLCVSDRKKQYYADNKEKVCAKAAEYKQNNKENVVASQAEYRQNNKEKIAARNAEYHQKNKEKIAARNAEYRQNNKEKIAAKKVEYAKHNKEKIAARKAEYTQQNRKKNNEYNRNRHKNNANAKLANNIRSRINKALKGHNKSFHTKEILGIDIENYKKWLLFQMTPEMNFNNIHIDHVKPISSFDISNDNELLEAFNWRNTQPLLKQDNLRKSNKVNEEDYNNQFKKAREFNLLQTFLSETNLL